MTKEQSSEEQDTPNEYDVAQQHQRFQSIFRYRMLRRKQTNGQFGARDWVVKCFDSVDEFERQFPDRFAAKERLDELQEDFLIIRRTCARLMEIDPFMTQEEREEE